MSADLNIPPAPALDGMRHLHSGKVRDLYEVQEGEHAGQLLVLLHFLLGVIQLLAEEVNLPLHTLPLPLVLIPLRVQ